MDLFAYMYHPVWWYCFGRIASAKFPTLTFSFIPASFTTPFLQSIFTGGGSNIHELSSTSAHGFLRS